MGGPKSAFELGVRIEYGGVRAIFRGYSSQFLGGKVHNKNVYRKEKFIFFDFGYTDFTFSPHFCVLWLFFI